MDTKTIDLVYFNAGGGHRSAANALETVIREQGRPWRVRLLNLTDLLDPQGLFRKATGIHPEDIYNQRLARGWTFGLAQELKVLQALIRLGHDAMVRQLGQHWRKAAPDLVVSLVPNFNRAMYEGLSEGLPRTPYVTILTDFADHPPHFWMECNQRQHLICGTSRAVSQALDMGFPPQRIHATSGMIIRPDFYRNPSIDRTAEMRALQLDPDRPTGLVMFGGHGSRIMQSISSSLDDVQLILICGHNAPLAARLRKSSASAPRFVAGFTPKIRDYMHLADFFIGKPGPGSISEAVHAGLPVIVVRNRWTMPQERYNTDWIREKNAGVVLNSFKSVRDGVMQVIDRIDELRASIGRIHNRAVFEIPEILERILSAEQPSRIHHSALREREFARMH